MDLRPYRRICGATHRRLLQRPVHGEARPPAALHPRRMRHHLPLCADDRLLGGHRPPPRRHQGELQHVHRRPVVRRRRLHRGLLVPRLRQQHRPAGQHGPNVGQAIFSLWMALGSVLGYLSGANAKWHEWLPWLKTAACCDACANLKGAFLTAVILIIISMSVTLALAGEEQLGKDNVDASSGGACSAFVDLFKSLRNLPPAMFKVLAVTAVTWLSWFPFFQYNTDWMGREIYHGEPQGLGGKADAFNAGVREGAVGLLFCSIALGVTSFLIPKLCRKLTSRVVWSISNLMVFVIMTVMVVLGIISMKGYKPSLTAGLLGPDSTFRGIALALFALIGIPQAVLFSVPWAVASEVATEEGGGQGLTIGVLNIAIVLPQLVIALTAGPIDGVFNKGNTPAFGIGAAFALICAVLSMILLPKTRGVSNATVMAGGH
ncbi:hypothetical protein PVAP13_1KG345800 [Panicum virgatum]|uniref:Uncharacterized protein n=1 Tax=Panicum virgatum TaxID=38727 RepID=A0A8T0XCU7_PANVG|nr:hypothetical protein PVAP13_1KG345800 [Panicum virgatum]